MSDSARPTPAARLRALSDVLPPATGPLRALEPIRQLCLQIRLDSRIEESLQAAPAQAGPLNAQGVVVRTLQRLQQLSPAYLEGLMRQVDAWSAMEALQAAPGHGPGNAPGTAPGNAPGAGRPRAARGRARGVGPSPDQPGVARPDPSTGSR